MNFRKSFSLVLGMTLICSLAFAQSSDEVAGTKSLKKRAIEVKSADLENVTSFRTSLSALAEAYQGKDEKMVNEVFSRMVSDMKREIADGKKKLNVTDPLAENETPKELATNNKDNNRGNKIAWLKREQMLYNDLKDYKFDMSMAGSDEHKQKLSQLEGFASIMNSAAAE